MLRVSLCIVLCIAVTGCSVVPPKRDAWQPADFARASNPEVVQIAAALLKQLFSDIRKVPDDRIYYVSILDADWKLVLEQTGLPLVKQFVFGYRDYFLSTDGLRDTATGLRVYTIHIDVQTALPSSGPVEVYYVLSAGTGRGTSASMFTLERKDGEWIVVRRKLNWAS
jgi:hypothetical protein